MPSGTSEDEKLFNDHIKVDIWIMPIIVKEKACVSIPLLIVPPSCPCFINGNAFSHIYTLM